MEHGTSEESIMSAGSGIHNASSSSELPTAAGSTSSDAPPSSPQATGKRSRFDWPVDENDKATVIKLWPWTIGRSKLRNPHARGFWCSWITFFVAFLGWFAFAPLMPEVRKHIGLCDSLTEDGSCVCGPSCQSTIQSSHICSIAGTILMRIASGYFLERFGPRRVNVAFLTLFSVPVFLSTLVANGPGLIATRFFIGFVGATFVTGQFWCTLLFAPNVVGTANATAAGWGNLGGGVTQFLMTGLFNGFVAAGLHEDTAWRVSMLVPATLYWIVAAVMWFGAQDTPNGTFHAAMLGKSKTSIYNYIECLSDYRIVLMIVHYAACFGTEITMYNQLPLYFFDHFGLSLSQASGAAAAFGLINTFARTLGGLLSDRCYRHYHIQGRLWAHFACILLEGLTLVMFGFMRSLGGAIAILCLFSIFVQMSEGTTYSIVPFMSYRNLGIVTAIVGAGGNVGAVAWGFIYKDNQSAPNVAYQVHGGAVMAIALTAFLIYWPHFGSMLHRPKEGLALPPGAGGRNTYGHAKTKPKGSPPARTPKTVIPPTVEADAQTDPASPRLSITGFNGSASWSTADGGMNGQQQLQQVVNGGPAAIGVGVLPEAPPPVVWKMPSVRSSQKLETIPETESQV